jgi:hypothetical protein
MFSVLDDNPSCSPTAICACVQSLPIPYRSRTVKPFGNAGVVKSRLTPSPKEGHAKAMGALEVAVRG